MCLCLQIKKIDFDLVAPSCIPCRAVVVIPICPRQRISNSHHASYNLPHDQLYWCNIPPRYTLLSSHHASCKILHSEPCSYIHHDFITLPLCGASYKLLNTGHCWCIPRGHITSPSHRASCKYLPHMGFVGAPLMAACLHRRIMPPADSSTNKSIGAPRAAAYPFYHTHTMPYTNSSTSELCWCNPRGYIIFLLHLFTGAPCLIHTPPWTARLAHPVWLHFFFLCACGNASSSLFNQSLTKFAHCLYLNKRAAYCLPHNNHRRWRWAKMMIYASIDSDAGDDCASLL